MPVERARRQELRQSPVLLGLARMAVVAEPSEVIQRECTKHRRWAQRPGYPGRQPVVDFVRLVAAYLAERMLDLVGMLSGCNAIGIQAVEVPAGPGACRAFIAPATDAGRRRFFPPGRAVHEPPAMLCGMPLVVQHEALELAASVGCQGRGNRTVEKASVEG